MPDPRPAPDDAVVRIAARQHGVVTRRQLLAAGLTRNVIDYRLRRRHLQVVHRGVYLVGPVPPPRHREMAACLACGPAAVVSHRSAAGLWRLSAPPGRAAPVDITTRTWDRARPGIRTHRSRTLRDGEVTRLAGIPITTPARTIVDLAARASFRQLERALAEAQALGLTTPDEVGSLLRRYPRRPGAPLLRTVLDLDHMALTRSPAEERFLNLVRKAALLAPEVNVTVAGYEVDFLWRATRLVAEVDGFGPHSSREAFERDRRRDADLLAAGFRVLRVTWRELTRRPEAVVARLARALG